jgi:hypothetical protein
MSYRLDTSFIQQPHHTDPRRLYSQTSTDWQLRVDHDRLRRDRLARARAAMEQHDLGGLIMFVGENIRYVTGTFQGNWKHNIFIRYAVLPRDGDPVLFETVGSDFECAKLDAPWLNGNVRPAFTWRWAEGAEPMMVGRMADSVLLVMCRRGGRYVAGALNLIGSHALYGRNWGCVEDHPFLHFEVCYHQAIDFAIAKGLKVVEAGAQGEHKLARGYRPVTTHSAHFIAHAGLRQAVADYLRRERREIERMGEYLEEHGPFRKGE